MFNSCKKCGNIFSESMLNGKIYYECKNCGVIFPLNFSLDFEVSIDLNEIFLLAIWFYHNQKFESSLDCFKYIINFDPFDEGAWYYIGTIYLTENLLENAYFAFNSAIKINPEYIDPWFEIGRIYDKLGSYEEKMITYAKCYDLGPESYASSWLNYIDKMIDLEEFEEALFQLKNYREFCNRFLMEEYYFEGEERKRKIQEYKNEIKTKELEKETNRKLEESKVARNSYKSKLKELGIDYLYYISDLDNVPSILKEGILSRNQIKNLTINFTDISVTSVQKKRKSYMKSNYGKDIHDFACLFFDSHTPMLRQLVFEFQKDHEVAILQVDPAILDVSLKSYYTDKSCNRSDFKMYNELKDLNNLKWEYITRDYDLIKSKIDKSKESYLKGIRGAEILVKNKVPPRFISQEIIVKSKKAKKRLIQILNKNNRFEYNIKVDKMKFPLRFGATAFRSKMRAFKRTKL